MANRLDTPAGPRRPWPLNVIGKRDPEYMGRISEAIARFTGTPKFLVYLTVFCLSWIMWNTVAPDYLRFDSAALGFTALTLMLSLQASYSAPLILLAQNRQDARDKVSAENDRQVAARNLADTEFLTREIAALRIALADVSTRDFVRSELRDAVDTLTEAHERDQQTIALLREELARERAKNNS